MKPGPKPGTHRSKRQTKDEFAERMAKELREEAARLATQAQKLLSAASAIDGK